MTKSTFGTLLFAGCLLGLGVAVACSSSTPTGLNCGDGSQACDTLCTVISRDPANCGACGKTCAMGEVCSQGTCASACGGGTTKCGTECVDTKSDGRNCGACGKACASNEVCMAGACASSCGTGTMKCGMGCVDTKSDRTNCGGCGTTCKDGEICNGGTCSISCQQGLSKCNSSMLDGGGSDGGPMFNGDFCADLQNDNLNCGMCGNSCSVLPFQKCIAGVCKKSPVTTGFTGNSIGPDYSGQGWTQCAGWFDSTTANEIPNTGWGDGCKVPNTTSVRIACGADNQTVRYVDLGRNVFLTPFTAYPENNLITNANFNGYTNACYATGNDMNLNTSWIGGGAGCGEANVNLTINNSCSWEAANCFGQNLAGNRYLYVYVK